MENSSSPDRIAEMLTIYQRSAALKTAIEIDLFTAVGSGSRTVTAIADACKVSRRGARILANYMVILELLTKENGCYDLAPEAADYLDRRARDYCGAAASFLASPILRSGFDRLTEAVRRGGTAIDDEGTTAPESDVWVDFARGMVPLMASTADALAESVPASRERPLRILDVASGHGMFGISFLQRHAQTEVFAVDWPAVLDIARGNARASGVLDRFHGMPGNALEIDLGTGYDLALVANLFHHFDPPTCVKLMKKIRCALADGGRMLTVEYVPDESRVTPPRSAGFALVMLATTPFGDAYTFAEYRQMLAEAGFTQNALSDLADSAHQLIESR